MEGKYMDVTFIVNKNFINKSLKIGEINTKELKN